MTGVKNVLRYFVERFAGLLVVLENGRGGSLVRTGKRLLFFIDVGSVNDLVAGDLLHRLQNIGFAGWNQDGDAGKGFCSVL